MSSPLWLQCPSAPGQGLTLPTPFLLFLGTSPEGSGSPLRAPASVPSLFSSVFWTSHRSEEERSQDRQD